MENDVGLRWDVNAPFNIHARKQMAPAIPGLVREMNFDGPECPPCLSWEPAICVP